jgi:hypothetical protein
MYQTNPTEMFGERHLALLREAADRRLARRLRRLARRGTLGAAGGGQGSGDLSPCGDVSVSRSSVASRTARAGSIRDRSEEAHHVAVLGAGHGGRNTGEERS